MFDPEWETGCPCCAAFLDQVGHLAHLRARNTSFAAVSRAPFTRILPFKARMGLGGALVLLGAQRLQP